MLMDLKAIGDTWGGGKRIDTAALRCKYADGFRFDRPAETVAFAQGYCEAALLAFDQSDESVALQGARALFHFITNLPPDICAAIESIPTNPDPIERAWIEPITNAYVSLCATVHDVWVHLSGPEARDDAAILSEIIRSRPRRVLDFGAGAGHFAIALARRSIAVDAVEIDPVKRRFLAVRSDLAGVRDRIAIAPLEAMPEQYEMVLAVNVLDHLARPADVLHDLSRRVSSCGRLVLQAEFPEDGWHQSDAEQVERCGRMIWRNFYPLPQSEPPVRWLEVLSRKAREFDGERALLKPQLHPSTAFRSYPGEDRPSEWVLLTFSFYARPCVLSDAATQLCARFDGTRTIVAAANECDIELQEAIVLCEFLHQQRLIFWGNEVSGETAAPRSISRSVAP
jgi:SAM-dependent methyltransferase